LAGIHLAEARDLPTCVDARHQCYPRIVQSAVPWAGHDEVE
jgi:hypothetical protein